jgi:hypothetical protein
LTKSGRSWRPAADLVGDVDDGQQHLGLHAGALEFLLAPVGQEAVLDVVLVSARQAWAQSATQ